MWQVLFRETLKMRSVPEKAIFDTEYPFRTVEACFLHRTPLKMHRVPQEAFFSTARMFRTVEGGVLVRRASENASHLVVRSTGKRVAVASERPVYPRTGQRQVPPQRSLAYILVDLIQDTKARPSRNGSRSI